MTLSSIPEILFFFLKHGQHGLLAYKYVGLRMCNAFTLMNTGKKFIFKRSYTNLTVNNLI